MSLRALFLSLRRQTTSGLYIPELDGLRFVAIASVYLYHLAGDVLRHTPASAPHSNSFVFRLTQQLNVGVPLFFCISGMILGLPFAKYWLQLGPGVSIKRYLLRRVTRLEPPYLLALLLFFVLKIIGHRSGFVQMLPHFWASVVYSHNLIYREPSSIDYVAWSLEIEIQFYLLAPILAFVFAIRAGWLRRSILVTAVLFSALASALYPSALMKLTLAGYIQYFLIGFLLADVFLLSAPAQHESHLWDIVTAIGWPAFAMFLVFCPAWHRVGLPCFIFLLYVPAFYGKATKRLLGSIWVSAIGGMCYSIYLLHNYTVALAGMITERVGGSLSFEARLAIQMILVSPVVLLVSAIYYRLIEQPCMQPDWPAKCKTLLQRQLRLSGASQT